MRESVDSRGSAEAPKRRFTENSYQGFRETLRSPFRDPPGAPERDPAEEAAEPPKTRRWQRQNWFLRAVFRTPKQARKVHIGCAEMRCFLAFRHRGTKNGTRFWSLLRVRKAALKNQFWRRRKSILRGPIKRTCRASDAQVIGAI